MQIKNYSFKADCRSVVFQFPVSFDTDPAQAKAVIAAAVKESEYSIPYHFNKEGNKDYSEVFFLSLSDSAMVMSVTVYYETGTPTEVVRDDINTRVNKALDANGIEIPYNYITLVQKNEQ